jgi:hypothetical protein
MREDLYFIMVICQYGYAGHKEMGWQATAHWQDGKFAEGGAIEGEIRTRYFEPTLTQAIDKVMEVVEQWGLKTVHDLQPTLIYLKDGEGLDEPPPENFKQILHEEAERRGWATYSTNRKKEDD